MKLYKISADDLKKYSRNTCMIPIDEDSISRYKSIPLNTEINITGLKVARKNKTHNTFIQVLLSAIENGLLTKNIFFQLTPDFSFTLRLEVIQAKLVECQYDANPELRCLIDIFEEIFIEHEVYTDVNGRRQTKKGSISFQKKDEISFRQFCDKVYKVITDNLNCFVEDLLKK